MVADFDKQHAIILMWPYDLSVWSDSARPIGQLVCQFANKLSEYGRVYLCNATCNCIEGLSTDVVLLPISYDDIWARDTGPIPVDAGGHRRYVSFDFNGWGGSLNAMWQRDDALADILAQQLHLELEHCPLCLEGGNLLSDGNGTVIAIQDSIVNANRNGDIDRVTAERLLLEHLSVDNIVWIDRGLFYDETGGHIDNVCSFVDEHTLLVSYTDDADHEQYQVCQDIIHRLSGAVNAYGVGYDIVRLPMPSAQYRTEQDCAGLVGRSGTKDRQVGEPMLCSYANYVVFNDAVFVPQFGVEQDQQALDIISSCYKNKCIVPMPARAVILGGGGLHCITRNI